MIIKVIQDTTDPRSHDVRLRVCNQTTRVTMPQTLKLLLSELRCGDAARPRDVVMHRLLCVPIYEWLVSELGRGNSIT
jgi:hypothetical protein